MKSAEPIKKYLVISFILISAWVAGVFLTPVLISSGNGILKKTAHLLYFFYEPVCHQETARCVHIFNFPLAVCSRCLGIYLGVFFTILAQLIQYKIFLPNHRPVIVLMVPTVADFILEKFIIYENDWIRLITGLLFGIAIVFLLNPAFVKLDNKEN